MKKQSLLFGRFIFLYSFFILSQSCFGQTETFINFLSGAQVKIDSILINQDNLFGTTAWSTVDTTYSCRGFLRFEIDPTTSKIIKDNYTCELTVQVTTWDSSNTTSIFDTTLQISYDTIRNSPYNNSSSWYFKNVYRIEAKIIDVNYSQGSGSVISPDIFRLYSEINIFRNYLFDCSAIPTFTAITNDLIRNQENISWAQIPGATHYDLEWTFYDDSSLIAKAIALSQPINLDSVFKTGATRVSIRKYDYSIPLIYTAGYILYRVRAVIDLPGFQTVYSEWSSTPSDHFHIAGHEPSMNWQFTGSFSEEGKRKEVASYFDGSFRNRQTVTRINSVDTSMVAETIFDFQGRPAVQALPAPTFNPQIRYFPNFNVNSAFHPYSWLDFDIGDCGFSPGKMNSDSGSSKYFSVNNPRINHPPDKYIPDANGYVFSVTEYTPDLTGRINRQSAVGEQLNLGTGHEIKYFYGKPSQTELDRLFGNDVGDSSHYMEELVIDPNGQGSVTYTDEHDRVIATALTGQSPRNLDTIPEYRPDTVIRTYLLDNNRREGSYLKSNTSFLAKSAGTYTFLYSLLPEDFYINNCSNDTVCYDCAYDINIQISSNCSPDSSINQPLLIKSYHNYKIPLNDTTFFFDTLCIHPDSSSIDTFQLFLEVGAYYISREVSISQDALDFYSEKFFRENTCNNLQHYIDIESAGIDSLGCNLTCGTCLQQLGDTVSFVAHFFNSANLGYTPTADDTLNAYLLYNAGYQSCLRICNPISECGSKRSIMEGDLTPGGQYAHFALDGNGNYFMTSDVSSIFYWNGVNYSFASPSILPYLDESNNPITVNTPNGSKTPDQLDISEYINLFQPEWLHTLIRLHPEYCYLQYCDNNSLSHDFDANMMATETFQAAIDSGFLNPLAIDPYFNSLDGSSQKSLMQGKMHLYQTVTTGPPTVCSTRKFSMWEYAAFAATKNHFPPGLNLCSDTLDIFNLCTGDQNVAWLAFRALYQKEKDNIFAERENYFATNTCQQHISCGNYCIGASLPQYVQLGHGNSLCNQGPYCVPNYEEKVPRFYHMTPSSNFYWQSQQQAQNWINNQNQDSVANSLCGSYRNYWQTQLYQYCGPMDSLTLNNLLNTFQEICKHGYDSEHPVGASSVPPGDNYLPANFQDAMEQILGVSSANPSCNSIIIEQPRQYESPVNHSVNDIAYPKPSKCTCEKYDSLFSLMVSSTGNWSTDSFQVFLQNNYSSVLTTSELSILKTNCHDTICQSMTAAIQLPQVLSCDDCLPCDSIANAYAQFINEYPDGTAMAHSEDIIAGYFNIHFGFHLQPADYFSFMSQCNISTAPSGGITCEDIRNVFGNYLASGTTLSLTDYMNNELQLTRTSSDYTSWIFNCVFDTVTTSLISCDTLVSKLHAFQQSSISSDSFVVWMNDHLFLNYTYLEYGAWIKSCDSTLLIPYSASLASSSKTSNDFHTYAKGTPNIILRRTKAKETPLINIKNQFEAIEKNRKAKLRYLQSTTPSVNKISSESDSVKSSHEGILKGVSKKFTEKTNNKTIGYNYSLDGQSSFIESFKNESLLRNQLTASTQLILPEIFSDNSDYFSFLKDGDWNETSSNFFNPTVELNCSSLYIALGGYDCHKTKLLIEYLNAYFGIEHTDLEWMNILYECGYRLPCIHDCKELVHDLRDYDCTKDGPLDVFLNNIFNTHYTLVEYNYILTNCGITITCDSCKLVSEIFKGYNCKDKITIADFLNNQTHWNYSDTTYFAILNKCNVDWRKCIPTCDSLKKVSENYSCISSTPRWQWLNEYYGFSFSALEWSIVLKDCPLPCDSCAALHYVLEHYNCHGTQSILQYFNSFTSWTYSNSQLFLLINKCGISCTWKSACIPTCDSLLNLVSKYPCNSATQLWSWLNSQLNLQYSQYEWDKVLVCCNIAQRCDTCSRLTTLINTYPCHGTQDISGWLSSNTGWTFTQSDWIAKLDSCHINWRFKCSPCDSLKEHAKHYPCNSATPLWSWMNNNLNVHLSEYQWEKIFNQCPIHCDTCTTLDSLVQTYNCHGGSSLSAWLNSGTGWSLSDSAWMLHLDSCHMSWHTCAPCSTLQSLYSHRSCNDTTPAWAFFNDTLHLSFTQLEWNYILSNCALTCDSCLTISQLVSAYNCHGGSSLSSWLQGQTGWGLSDSAWMVRLDSCDISWHTCAPCSTLQSLYSHRSCSDTTPAWVFFNDTLNLSFTHLEWNHILSNCLLSCDTCQTLSILMTGYSCNTGISIVTWLNNQTGWNLSDSVWMAKLNSCGIDWDNCFNCDTIQLASTHRLCTDTTADWVWLNSDLGKSLTEYEWSLILAHCPLRCDTCSSLSGLVDDYNCTDSISLIGWINNNVHWNLSDSVYLNLFQNCHLDSVWVQHCFPMCDSLVQAVRHYPCNSPLPLWAWLNEIYNTNQTQEIWNIIFSFCPVDTAWCEPGCDSLQVIVHNYLIHPYTGTLIAYLDSVLNQSFTSSDYNQWFDSCGTDTMISFCDRLHAGFDLWKNEGSLPPMEAYLNSFMGLSYNYWTYVRLLDSCGIQIKWPCSSLDSLVTLYNPLPQPKPLFYLWADNLLHVNYTSGQIFSMIGSCSIHDISSSDCDTLNIYVEFYNLYRPAGDFYSWIDSTLGYTLTINQVQQWLDSCGMVNPSACSVYDSLYHYYVDQNVTAPLAQWFNGILGFNFTYYDYVHLFDPCFAIPLPCDTLIQLSISHAFIRVPPPFNIYVNNILGLSNPGYSPAFYLHLSDSCSFSIHPGNCDSLQALYQGSYSIITPKPDLASWINNNLGINFTYWDYVHWFDSCGIYLPLPCDTLAYFINEYHSSVTSPPSFVIWTNAQLNLHFPYGSYFQMLDSCGLTPSACDSLDDAMSAYLAQNDTALNLITFLNAILGRTWNIEDYQSALLSCHPSVNTYYLCDKSDFPAISLDSAFQDNCLDDFLAIAFSNARHDYDLYIDSLKGEFETAYTGHCLNSLHENFCVDGPLSEYHYTLYYYDQSGNLVKTIPPNGVHPFGDQGTLQQIANYRRVHSGTPYSQQNGFQTKYYYNTLNKPVAQSTPDADNKKFWYDNVGRFVISQDGNQAAYGNTYSYTKYDDLNRVVETGAINSTSAMTNSIARLPSALATWLNAGAHREIAHTYYDNAAFNVSPGFIQQNLRGRVASVTYDYTYGDNDSLTYDNASHFSYDISGNVTVLMQENNEIRSLGLARTFLKRIDYDYDLISGKVNNVYYQRDSMDQFTHRYEYDDDNRLTNLFTSRDGVQWDRDAHYLYYLHGPLARLELGENDVQGIDYAYTLQGWVKGINSGRLNPDMDMGNDGLAGSNNNPFARDALGFTLGYFNSEYTPISADPFEINYNPSGGSSFGDKSFRDGLNMDKGLFNGNIRNSVISMDSLNYPTVGYAYRYDQLNRITGQDAFKDVDSANNKWNTSAAIDDYRERVSYDPNGNITNYLRNGAQSNGNYIEMDSLQYHYLPGTNQMDYVGDLINSSNYGNDIDDESTGNFHYDNNGNMTNDDGSNILGMNWTTDNKLSGLVTGTAPWGLYAQYTYDAFGNRLSKYEDGGLYFNFTWYVNDAQGNVLATYVWLSADTFALKELNIYGNKRIGVVYPNLIFLSSSNPTGNSSPGTGWLGRKVYELTNHLGNVLATLTDKKIPFDNNNDGITDWYLPEIASENDYYPFGMLQPDRKFNAGEYRFGFNGQERSDDIAGVGNHNTAMFWEYDTRLGRRWNIDPVVKPFESRYTCLSNNPILRIDPNGDSDYKVDRDGNITIEKTTKNKTDVLHSINRDGKTVPNNSLTLQKGILNNVQQAKSKDGFRYDFMKINGDKSSTDLFEYLSSNTDVEWGQVKFGKTINYLSTTHRTGMEIGAGILVTKLLKVDQNTVREHIHSHPSGNLPSGFSPDSKIPGDKAHAEYMHNNYPNANYKLKVYNVPDKSYIEYNYKEIITK